jgi:hypothetical protein
MMHSAKLFESLWIEARPKNMACWVVEMPALNDQYLRSDSQLLCERLLEAYQRPRLWVCLKIESLKKRLSVFGKG